MNFNLPNDLGDDGFEGFLRVGELFTSCRCVPDEVGVYLILWDSKSRPEFVNPGSGGYFKGRDPNVPVGVLEEKWIAGTLVVYIGKAGGSNGVKWSDHTLRDRLSQYMEFGKGKPVGHRGGRYIWQLRDCQNALVCWKTVSQGEGDPSIVEKNMIDDFVRKYGRLPFANLRH